MAGGSQGLSSSSQAERGHAPGFPWGLQGRGEEPWGEDRAPGCGPRNGCGGLQPTGLGGQRGCLGHFCLISPLLS